MTEQAPIENIQSVEFSRALGERYLNYALSTITSRSLPDVRDGLKPVHRRLLYAMRLLKLDPNAGFKKCARVVGDVIGKYHPHGDQAVYDALVRLAQDFAQRYPLVDGQGNFGNIDGDNAAAMRYTEARLTRIADWMLDGIDEDAVDFRPTYDGEEEEPVLLPAAFPNLLANGATGIAVGMATSIPPHNAVEICNALIHLSKFPNATIGKLVELVPGPDFPTGGVIVEPPENIAEAYRTGRGSFRQRACWSKEELRRGGYQVVVTQIPYQVQKGRLVEKLAELITSRKLPMLADVRDESTDDVRLVLEPKSRTVDSDMLMEALFRHSDLEVRIGLNMNVIDAQGSPRVMDLRQVLRSFLDHRHEVLVRRTGHRLEKIARRLEVLEGYLVAYLNLDEVIRIIREEDQPKQELMRTFKLTDGQAEAILNMRLRSLRKLEEMEIRREHKELSAEQTNLKGLLESDDRRQKAVEEQIRDLKAKLGKMPELGDRRTVFAHAPAPKEVPLEAMIERESVTVICSDKGWIRAVKGHIEPTGAENLYKKGDRGRFWLHAETTDKLLMFATNGRFYTLGCDKLPRGRGHGEPVRLMIDLGNDQDIVALFVHQPERKLLVASTDGRGFVVEEAHVMAQTRSGRQVLNVSGDVEARICTPATGNSLAVVGDNRKLLIFPLEEVPEMTRGRGVMLQKYRDGGLSDVVVFDLAEGLSWRMGSSNRVRTETDLMPWQGKRAQAGRLPPKGFPKNNRFY